MHVVRLPALILMSVLSLALVGCDGGASGGGSKDGTIEASEAAGAKMLHIAQADFNHGRARNLAIEASGGEILALLIQDAEPKDETWLRHLVSAYDDPRVAGPDGAPG